MAFGLTVPSTIGDRLVQEPYGVALVPRSPSRTPRPVAEQAVEAPVLALTVWRTFPKCRERYAARNMDASQPGVAADFMEIGGSPVPGVTLRNVLRGHTDAIGRIAWSPDGRFLASPSMDGTIRIWNTRHGGCLNVLQHGTRVNCVAWAPDGTRLVSGTENGMLRLWVAPTGQPFIRLKLRRHLGLRSLAWSAEHNMLASADARDGVLLRNTTTFDVIALLKGGDPSVRSCFDLAWSPDGRTLAMAFDDIIRLWPFPGIIESQGVIIHSGVENIAFSPDGRLASASQDGSIRIVATTAGGEPQVVDLERHAGGVTSVCFSSDGTLLTSKSHDQRVILWRCDDWTPVAELHEGADPRSVFFTKIAFHPIFKNVLATYGDNDQVIRIWELDLDVLLGRQPAIETIRYTTAKVVLVGDSGVGKTGLGWRLAHNEYKEHSSTHGQQFWVVDELNTRRADGTECEAVLWDLAGQHVYRPIHAIFLDDVDAALVLFDPTNRQDPLKGVQFWLEQLAGKDALPPTVLVGARADRGSAVLSQQDLEQFCARYDVTGGYLSVSAKSGDGLHRLLDTLKRQIPWDRMTATVTTVTFKRIKEYVLDLKEQPDRGGVLVSPPELRRQLQATDREWQFTDVELAGAVKHLENHGYVAVLRTSSGDESILLTPDLLVDLASSIVLRADKHPRELGALSETDLLQDKYPFPELAGLPPTERQILVDAAVARFVDHNICFRESLGTDALLIFPRLIKQKRPLLAEVETVDDISYVICGRVENVYSALVVLLGYTQTFTRIDQWQNQAQYELGKGEICGFRMIEEREGEIELVLYHSPTMPHYGRTMFRGLFEQFLYQRDVDVDPFPPIMCANDHRQERATVVRRIRDSKTFIFCDECGHKVDLPASGASGEPDGTSPGWIRREEALAHLRSTYETHLVRVKSFRRDRAAPRCYLSYLPQQRDWAAELTRDLREAGVLVLDDRDSVQDADIVVIVSTLAYQRAWQLGDPAVSADADLVRARVPDAVRGTTVELVLDDGRVPPRDPGQRPAYDFRDASYYPVSLFDLVLTLYAIRRDHPAFQPLRDGLRQQWQQRLSAFDQSGPPFRPLSIFISYAHRDEDFKDELVTMLAGLQRRGVIDAWQDRRVEAGDEWRASIEAAMNDCELAILLISPGFLASRFIQDTELPRLLQRRKDQGLRIVPIIVRHCPWQSEPMLSDLQALPQDGKPVITFPEDTGERDQAWTEISQVIEAQATDLARRQR